MQIQIKKLDGQKEEFSLEPSDSVMKVGQPPPPSSPSSSLPAPPHSASHCPPPSTPAPSLTSVLCLCADLCDGVRDVVWCGVLMLLLLCGVVR